MTDIIKLSKTIAHALRHEPQTYNLVLDNEGWVSLSDLITSLNKRGLKADEKTILEIIERSAKKRFQINNGKIRAYYGHSINEKILKQPQSPPEILYHGTIAGNVESIMSKGLLPMNRQYVHLSIDTLTAQKVGERRKGEVVIIKILAQKAYREGILFFKEENGIWLSDAIPPQYIHL